MSTPGPHRGGPPPPQRIRIRSQDGAESDATVFAADAAPARAVVICTPALGISARYYEGLARALARPGLRVVTAELRGNGSSSVRARRGVDFGYHELVDLDLPAVIGACREAFPGARLLLLGHSIGAHISAMYASVNPGRVRGLVFVAAGTPFFKGWRFPQSLGMLAVAHLTRGVSGLLGYFPGRTFGFFGTEAARLMREWAALATRGRFEVTGSPHDFERELAALAAPILALSFEGDFFAPPGALEHLLSKMPRTAITRERLAPADLGATSLDHFRWAKHPGPLADRIAGWAFGTPGVL